jgi:hypothetical protein
MCGQLQRQQPTLQRRLLVDNDVNPALVHVEDEAVDSDLLVSLPRRQPSSSLQPNQRAHCHTDAFQQRWGSADGGERSQQPTVLEHVALDDLPRAGPLGKEHGLLEDVLDAAHVCGLDPACLARLESVETAGPVLFQIELDVPATVSGLGD